MAEKAPNPLWYLLPLMVALLLFQFFYTAQRNFAVSYSEFRRLVETKGVDDLQISSDTVTGHLLPGGVEFLAKTRQEPDLPTKVKQQFEKEPVFTAVRMEDPDLVKLLDAQGLKYRAIQEKTWLTSLLAWVLPTLLLVGIWVYFFRKIGGGDGRRVFDCLEFAAVYAIADVEEAIPQ